MNHGIHISYDGEVTARLNGKFSRYRGPEALDRAVRWCRARGYYVTEYWTVRADGRPLYKQLPTYSVNFSRRELQSWP